MAEDRPRLFMGVDVSPSGPPGSPKQRYYVMIINEELKPVVKLQDVPLSSVIRIAWEYKPRVIASDNVLELAPGGRAEALAKVLSLLPPETKLVQVTATDEGFVDIREAAKRAGLDLSFSKPSPARTAFLAAAIAVKGLGLEVGFTREKTYIIVSKARGPKSGGWSQQRYQRRVRASVKIAADKVREALETAGLDFDVFYRSSEGGLESAIFIVYAPREKLYGIVKPHRGLDYWIRLETRYEGELTFKGAGEGQPERPIIVGVDAGMTTGLAVLSIDGRVLHLGSYKEADRGLLLNIIKGLGRPIVVSTDVRDPPELVRKLAAQLGARLYTPPYDLSVEEKEQMASKATEDSELKPKTPHERDSLAAAYRALMDFENKLSQVEAYANKFDLEIDVDRLKADVMRGLTIAEALEKQIEELIGEGAQEPRRQPEQVQAQQRQEDRRCEPDYDVELLRAQKEALERQLEDLRERLRHAEREAYLAKKEVRAELLKDEEVKRLRAQVSELTAELEKVKGDAEAAAEKVVELRNLIVKLTHGEVVLVRPLDELRVSSVRRSEQELGPLTSGEVVLIRRLAPFENEAVDLLAKAGVAAALISDENSPLANALRKKGVPALNANRYSVREVGGLLIIDSKVLDEARRLPPPPTAEGDSRTLERLLEEYRRQRASPRSR